MLHLITGNDFVWVKAEIQRATRGWPHVELVWADEVTEEWLVGYAVAREHLVIRQAHVLGEPVAREIKEWRRRQLVFVAPTMPPSRLKRRLCRVGKWVDCRIGSPRHRAKLAEFARSLDLPRDAVRDALSLSDVFWIYMRTVLGAPSVRARVKPRAYALSDWDVSLLSLTLSEWVDLLTGVVRVALKHAMGRRKWELVQEALRYSPPGEVSAVYAVGVRASKESLFERCLALSLLYEQSDEVPVAYVYLKLRELGPLELARTQLTPGRTLS